MFVDTANNIDPTPPKIFSIETVLGCNLKCPVCYVGNNQIERNKGIMRLDDFRVISNKIATYAEYVFLHLWGEPLLNPHLFEMIQITKTYAKVNISTNGQLLTKEIANKLIESGTDEIIVSLDGMTQDVYQKYRVGGDLNKVFEGIDWLMKAKKSHNSSTRITIQFVVMKHNQHQILNAKKYARQIGIPLYLKKMYVQESVALNYLPDNKKYWRYAFKDDKLKLQFKFHSCKEPWESFVILVNGDVVPCCFDINAQACMGNLLDSSFNDIWSGNKYNDFRNNILGKKPHSMCEKYCGKETNKILGLKTKLWLSRNIPTLINIRNKLNIK